MNVDAAINRWMQQAETNLTKWGPRSLETLALVMGEEYGELCRAIHDYNYANGSIAEVIAELKDTAAVCIQMATSLESEESK